MYYRLEIFDDYEQYSLVAEGEQYVNSITFTFDDENKAIDFLKTAIDCDKVVAISRSSTPF